MKPYYINIEPIFSEEVIQEMRDYAEKNMDKLIPYVPRGFDHKDGNNYIIVEPNIWKRWTKTFLLQPWGCVILLQNIGDKIDIHKDDTGNHRETVVIQPLTKSMEKIPCHFWELETDVLVRNVDSCYYKGPVILNTQKLHSVPTVTETRIAFQACYEQPFEEVVEYFKETI